MARTRRLSRALAAAAVVAAAFSSALGGCATSAPTAAPSPRPTGTAPGQALQGAPGPALSYAPLVIAPFGTALKDMPGVLTEVLVFHDTGGTRASDDGDCFRPSEAVSFLGRAPADHLLCFDHDRLKRIEAAVALPEADSSAVFAAACADWQRAATATSSEPDTCAGRSADTAFSARRTPGPESGADTVSITLIAIAPP